MSNATQVKHKLYYVKTNLFIKFHVNISQYEKKRPENIILAKKQQLHRSQTLLWYNQCNCGYDKFVTAGTISFNGDFTLTRKTEMMDGMKMSISFCVYIVFK